MSIDISKLLLITLINIILLSLCCVSVKSLPITSKPIESTAENLAWEAWLMVPAAQQTKTRKVTPKSIFIVPHKNNQSSACPPGEHWAHNRCIPTVAIDTDKALLNTLSQFAPASLDYDYDYEDDKNLTPGSEKLEGSADTNPFSIGDFVDEPFKLNIFSDTFPIGSSGSGDFSGQKDHEDENIFFVSERRRRPPMLPETGLSDLNTDSSNYGNEDSKNPDDDTTLFLSGIDAILVPAVSKNQPSNQKIDFSIYQETLNSTQPQINFTDEATKHEIDEILKNESLILGVNGAQERTTSTTAAPTIMNERNEARTTSSQDLDTTTIKLQEYEDYDSKTEFTRSITDLPPAAEETSQPIDFAKDVTSTILPTDDITTITEQKEDITTITSPTEEVNPDISTITVQSEETTVNSETTTNLPAEETTIISAKEDLPVPNQELNRASETSSSNSRFVYQQLTDQDALPPVINIAEELKKINDLVARNNIPTTTTQKPSDEATTLRPNDLLTKIILSSNPLRTSSPDSAPQTSTSTVWSSNSTSRNILSIDSSSKTSNTRIAVSSKEDQKDQQSTADPSSSTSPTPEVNEPDPYWWLPRGWSAERTEADRPLLSRFWSAISGIRGSETKV